MKNRNRIIGLVGLVAVVLFIGAGWYFFSNENVDVVHDVEPVSEAFLGLDETLGILAGMETPQQRQAYLDRHHPNLGNDVDYWLRRDGRLTRNDEVDDIEFRFGSLRNVSAESGDGDMRHGFFNDQLIAVVHLDDDRRMEFILRCMNGLSVPAKQLMTLRSVGSRTPIEQFTITRGQGITGYVGYLAAVDIAERHDLPLFRGRRMTPDNRISYDEARRLEHSTDTIQVTVYVEPGDVFDIRNGTYTPAHHRPHRG